MDDFQSAIAIVRATPITSPAGWRLITKTPVDSLEKIGFNEDESLVLIDRSGGMAAFSSSTGESAAIPSGVVPTSLLSISPDGWSTEQLAIDWPQVTLLLRERGFESYPQGRYVVVARPTGVVAWGFSPSGKHLVLATELGFGLWVRESVG